MIRLLIAVLLLLRFLPLARAKDLWHVDVKDPADPTRKIKRKTARHPDNAATPAEKARKKKAKRWLAIWIGPDGKEKSKACRTEDLAKKHAAKMEADVERGEYIDPANGKKLFGPVALKWLRLRDVGANSRRKYEGAYRLHIEPAFGNRQVRSIVPSEILEWLRDLGTKRGLETQEKAHWILQSVFDLAVADGMRKDNPVKSPIVPKPKPQPNEDREAWTADRVLLVADKHPAPYKAVPMLAAGIGLRQGEVFALAEEDFDFESGRVKISRQVIRIGKLIVFKLPKGGKVRTAPLSPGIARIVKAQIKAYEPKPYSLPWMGEDGKVAEEEHTCKLLFLWHGDHAQTHGKCLQTSSYNEEVWKPALSAAGIIGPPTQNARKIFRYEAAREDGMHACRHFYSTTLQDAGVSFAGVAAFLGHSLKGLPVTLRIYSHVTEETFEAGRVAIDRSLFRLRIVQDQTAGGTETEQAVSG